jgi:hypothetical protein
MIDQNQLKLELEQFSGSEIRFEYNFLWEKLLLTEGVKHLCEKAECYWLLNLIASYQDEILEIEEFQVWHLYKNGGNWRLTCSDGNGKNLISAEEISYSDFPLEEIKIWVISGTILLPNEY